MRCVELKADVQKVIREFDTTKSGDMVRVLEQVQGQLRSELTRDYLAGKIQVVKDTQDEAKRKALCKNLLPYLDWYFQGT